MITYFLTLCTLSMDKQGVLNHPKTWSRKKEFYHPLVPIKSRASTYLINLFPGLSRKGCVNQFHSICFTVGD
jgi:hypothetical protein